MTKELLTELKHYKEAYKRRKQGQVTQRNTVLRAARRHAIRITKAHLELNLARNTKGREKGFYKYISRKRKTWENVGLLLNGEGDLLRKNTEKVEVLSAVFAPFFTDKMSHQESQAPETSKKVWSKEDLPSVEEDKVREHLNKLHVQ